MSTYKTNTGLCYDLGAFRTSVTVKSPIWSALVKRSLPRVGHCHNRVDLRGYGLYQDPLLPGYAFTGLNEENL
jgi:hypothetical protein